MKYLIDANVFAKKAFDIAYPIIAYPLVAKRNDHERGLTLSGIAQLLDEMQPVDAIPIEYIQKTSKEWARNGYEESAESLDILVSNWVIERKEE